MANEWMMLLDEVGWMAGGALVSLGLLALAQRLQAWRLEQVQAEWDPY